MDPPILSNDFKFQYTTINGTVEKIEQIRANYPYQRGYRDFTPWPETSPSTISTKEIRGPHRVSLRDDISFYWTLIASQLQIASAIQNPFNSTIFLRHIIASVWMNTMEYLHAVLSELETKLWKIEHMISPTLTDAQKDKYLLEFTIALNEVNTLRRRVTWYIAEMKTNLEALGISPDIASSTSTSDQDFLALHARLLNYQSWAEKLMNVLTTHVNLMETEKSISDSKSLSRLTVLGFIFVPVSFVATLFSMGGDFAVGQSRFWIYFAVTVPLTVVILLMTFRKWWWRRAEMMLKKAGFLKHHYQRQDL